MGGRGLSVCVCVCVSVCDVIVGVEGGEGMVVRERGERRGREARVDSGGERG